MTAAFAFFFVPGESASSLFIVFVFVHCTHRTHRIPTEQKEAIQPIESVPTTIPPKLDPRNPRIYPASHPDTKGQFSMANQPNPHIFGLWKETGAPGGNPCRHGENVQTPHRQ